MASGRVDFIIETEREQRPTTYFLKFNIPDRSWKRKRFELKKNIENCQIDEYIESEISYRIKDMKQLDYFRMINRKMQIVGEPRNGAKTIRTICKLHKIRQQLIFNNPLTQTAEIENKQSWLLIWFSNVFMFRTFFDKTYLNSSRIFWTSISPIEGGKPFFFAVLIRRQSSYV